MGTNIDDNLAVHATCISNDFLDKYMADANGDYIKVYLFLLRHRGERFEIRDAADALNLTDHDIERAVRYWEKQGVFRDGAGKAVEQAITVEEHAEESEQILEAAAAAESMSGKAKTEAAVSAVPGDAAEMEAVSDGSLEDVKDDEEFAGILFVARHVLPSLPTGKQVDVLEFMYRELSMNAELIEFLLEYCAGLGKTTSRYLQAVAINWHEQGIATVKQAKGMIRAFEEKKTKPRASAKPNKFMNFDSSETVDYDSIARKKLMDRMKNGVK